MGLVPRDLAAVIPRARAEQSGSGERRRANRAAFEELSRSAISVGWWLVVSGVVLVLTVAVFLAASRENHWHGAGVGCEDVIEGPAPVYAALGERWRP